MYKLCYVLITFWLHSLGLKSESLLIVTFWVTLLPNWFWIMAPDYSSSEIGELQAAVAEKSQQAKLGLLVHTLPEGGELTPSCVKKTVRKSRL